MEKLTFRPTQDYIVFEIPKAETKTAGGIYKSPTQIKEEEEARNRFMSIVAIGESVKTLKVGDLVLMDGNVRQVAIDGVDYGLCREYNVVFVKLQE